MMKRVPIAVVFLLVTAAALAAFAAGVAVGDRGDDRRMPMMGAAMTGQGVRGPGDARGEAGYLAEMIAHHREAVAAAGELARSTRPEMRAFGEDIVRAQTAQIEQMEQWLAEWYPDQSLDVDYQPMMRDLTGLSGDRLDRVFLQDMIGHHMMAVMMSMQLLAQGPDHDEVADLARTIRDDQRAEIIQMRRWLVRWFGAAWGGHMGGAMGMGMMGSGSMGMPGGGMFAWMY